MKTEITAKDYKDIYEVCDWNPKAFSLVLKRLGYSDELTVIHSLNLYGTPIKSLVNVKEVKGYLNLWNIPIQDLGKLEKVENHLDLEGTSILSLGKLQYVEGNLILRDTPIEDLGNLKVVDGDLWLEDTPLSKKYSVKEIIQMVKVKGSIYL